MIDETMISAFSEEDMNADENIPVNDAEINTSSEKAKVSKSEKRLERLAVLKEKYEKASTAQEAAAKKTESISSQIEKLEKEIRTEEIAEIDKLRIEKNFSYGDIAKIIRNVPDGMTADDIINLFV